MFGRLVTLDAQSVSLEELLAGKKTFFSSLFLFLSSHLELSLGLGGCLEEKRSVSGEKKKKYLSQLIFLSFVVVVDIFCLSPLDDFQFSLCVLHRKL